MTRRVIENRLRRTAALRGWRLVKNRRRDPLSLDPGSYSLYPTAEETLRGRNPTEPAFTGQIHEIEGFLNDRMQKGEVASL